jgi:hypothetical protein
MFVIDSRDTLIFAREHISRLRDEFAADRLRRASSRRHPLVTSLRRQVRRSRIDPAPLAHRPA